VGDVFMSRDSCSLSGGQNRSLTPTAWDSIQNITNWHGLFWVPLLARHGGLGNLSSSVFQACGTDL